MSKFVINILSQEKNVATSKAKDDVAFFLGQEGYQTIPVKMFYNNLDKFFRGNFVIHLISLKLRKNDILVFQYPSYLGEWFDGRLLRMLNKKGVKTIAVVHDIDSLRFHEGDIAELKLEVHRLKRFDRVISSNSHMTNLLRKFGLNNIASELGIFDYLQLRHRKTKPAFSKNLVFAGNLKKSRFINDFPSDLTSKLELFGPILKSERSSNKCLEYKGMYKPEELIEHFSGGFGLVWDGDSAKEVSGSMGQYLKFNNPHKLSLYLSSGLPVVIWEEAALADFVLKNHLGIVVKSLMDIDVVLNNIKKSDYSKMLDSVKLVSQKLTKGDFIKKSVKIAVEDMEQGVENE